MVGGGQRQSPLPYPLGGSHIGFAVSQAHAFVLVSRSLGQHHGQLMTLAVQGLWLEAQLVAKMELP
jgi:hypothetical protein